MPVTINADDFGYDETVNRAIAEAFANKYIDTTTLMANMPAAALAYEIAKENGFTDKVGIHLNITTGMPLTMAIRSNPLICNPDGSFNAAFYHNTKYRLYMDRMSIDQIREELEAQINLFLSLGFSNMHIDSHHHVHTNYPLYIALKELSKKYAFEYIRLSRNLYRGGSMFNNIYKCLYNSGIKRLCHNTTTLFGSYNDLLTYFNRDPSRIADRTREIDDTMRRFFATKYIEIMVHPMYNEKGVLVDTDIPMSEEAYVLLPEKDY